MINYNSIVYHIKKKMGCSSAQAWDGLTEAYLQLDRSRPEPEQVAYLCKVGCIKIYNDLYNTDATVLRQAKALTDPETDEDLYAAAEEPCGDAEYIAALVKPVPKQYKLGVAVVSSRLLARTYGWRRRQHDSKPLNVETTRQILKQAGIPDTSEQARQVFTYLTTLKEA